MCGVCGFLTRGPGAPDQVTLDRMTDTLSHRGPDDRGTHLQRSGDWTLGLGHRRLSIIDTSTAGHQPLSNEDGSVQVVYNGEIYNFQELRRELVGQGHRFHSQSDTEVLVHLWEEHGPGLLERLNGIFALALWDNRQRQLLLARDQLGVKPLYYSWQNDTLVFGSQLRPLLASGKVSPGDLDPQALADYFALNYVPGPRSVLRSVRKLQPGHRLLWTRGQVRVERYWDLHMASCAHAGRPRWDHQAAQERLLATLRAAIRRQMVADVPLGMFLSGGVDSGTVLALMAEASPRPVQAFTVEFAEAGYSETDHARRAARRYGAEHHVLRVGHDLDELLPLLLRSVDEPYADSSVLPTLQVCRLARQHVTVALAGDGGDEVFAGYQTHRAHRLATWYRRLPGWLGGRALPWLARQLPVSSGKIPLDFKARQFTRAASQPPVAAHFLFKEFLDQAEREELLDPGEGMRPASAQRLFERAAERHPCRDVIDTALYLDQQIYMPDDILTKTDRASMAVGLEARVPLLDREVVELAATFPACWKLRGLKGKHILKEAVRPVVDPATLRRRKAGFNVPMAAWMRGPLGDRLLDLLRSGAARRLPMLRVAAVEGLLARHRARRAELSRPLWAAMMLLLWAEEANA